MFREHLSNPSALAAWVAVAIGSAAGGMFRYACNLIAAATLDATFPWPTLFVNVTGSLLIGLFAAFTDPGGRWNTMPLLRELLMVGVLGGYTTFSSFSLQTLALMRDGRWGQAISNVLVSVLLCLLAVWLGYSLGRGLKA